MAHQSDVTGVVEELMYIIELGTGSARHASMYAAIHVPHHIQQNRRP